MTAGKKTGMTIVGYVIDYTGRPKVTSRAENPRLDFELFKKIKGGEPITDHEMYTQYNPPEGFSLWRTKHGDVLAVRNEGAY